MADPKFPDIPVGVGTNIEQFNELRRSQSETVDTVERVEKIVDTLSAQGTAVVTPTKAQVTTLANGNKRIDIDVQRSPMISAGETLPTAASLPMTGDQFVIYGTWDLYRYSGSAWVKIGNIKGAGGNTTWFDGVDAPANDLGNNGDYFLQRVTLNVYRKANNAWVFMFTMQGSIWYFGIGEPASTLGKKTDIYTDTGTFRVYNKTSDTQWTFQGSQAGQNTQNFLSGTSAPSSAVGNNGDHFLVSSSLTAGTNYVYKKTNNSWGSPIANLKGADGTNGLNGTSIRSVEINASGHLIVTLTDNTVKDAGYVMGGAQGISITNATINASGHLIVTLSDGRTIDAGMAKGGQGDPGTAGTVIHNGLGTPLATLGVVGDYYINKETDDWYNKTASGWGKPIANLRGASGDRQVWTFTTQPSNAVGNNGDIAFVYSLYTIFEKTNNVWVAKATFQGVEGNTVWLWGNAAPQNDVGFNGYFHLNLSNGDISVKANDRWAIQGNLQGAKGEDFKYYFTTREIIENIGATINIDINTLTPTATQGTLRVGNVIQDQNGKQATIQTIYVTTVAAKVVGNIFLPEDSIDLSQFIKFGNDVPFATINDYNPASKKYVDDKVSQGNFDGGAVTGVKGDKETEYRKGNVNLTADNIGAQSQLVSGTNIKTINGESVLGSGNIEIPGGSGGVSNFVLVPTEYNTINLTAMEEVPHIIINEDTFPSPTYIFDNTKRVLINTGVILQVAMEGKFVVLGRDASNLADGYKYFEFSTDDASAKIEGFTSKKRLYKIVGG